MQFVKGLNTLNALYDNAHVGLGFSLFKDDASEGRYGDSTYEDVGVSSSSFFH
jgi:hypothetical protein